MSDTTLKKNTSKLIEPATAQTMDRKKSPSRPDLDSYLTFTIFTVWTNIAKHNKKRDFPNYQTAFLEIDDK